MLSIFSHSLNALVLRAHLGGALEANQLERLISWAPQTSLRVATANMREFGVLIRIEPTEGSLAATELTPGGRALLPVIDALERWLLLSPGGPIEIDGIAARGAVRILTSAWDSTAIRELAEQALNLAELSVKLGEQSYPATKRSMAKLRSTKLIASTTGKGPARYEASAWLRHAIAPILLAARWEGIHMIDATERMARLDIEAMFMLAVPLAELPVDTFGTCVLAAVTAPTAGGEAGSELNGVSLGFDEGAISSCIAGTGSDPTTWGLGTTDAWHKALMNGEVDELKVRGIRPLLVQSIVKGIHQALL